MMNKITAPGFDRINGRPIMVYHEFEWAGNSLRHSIDGVLRAEVPEEGLADYVEQYPDAATVIPAISSQAVLAQEVSAIADVVKADPNDNAEQIAYLRAQLAKLTVSQDNTDSGSPASSEAAPPASPVA